MEGAGILDYNQSGGSDTSTGVSGNETYELSEEEKKTLKYVKDTYDKAKKYREPYIEKWKDFYQYFRGKQWKTRRPAHRHSDVINLIFSSIQNQVPLMTDSRPTVDFIAEKPEDLEFAKILNDLMISDWDRLNWSGTLLECLYDSHIYGTALAMLDFDDEADFGLGSARWISLEPMYCYPSPGASDVNTGRPCAEFQYAEPVPVERLKQMFPKFAQYIKPDIRDLWQETKTDIKDVKYQSSLDQKTSLDGNATIGQVNTDTAMLMTTYCRPLDTDQQEISEKDEQGNDSVAYQTKLKYPKGRKIVSLANLVLEDGELDVDDKSFPIQKLNNYLDPRSFWGISDVEQAEGPQMMFNKVVSFSMDVLTLMGNPIWIVDTSSGVDTDNLYNIPGGIVEKAPGSEVRREAGTDLQPYVIQLIDRLKNWYDEVVGTPEVSRGVNPPGVVAARAIESLQQSGRTRIRQKTRNMDEGFLREMGRQYAQLVLKNYTLPRVRRVSDADGVQKYFNFSVEHVKLAKGPKTVVNYQEYVKDMDGELVPGPIVDKALMGTFDVRVSTISGLPFQKEEDKQTAFNLFDREVIDAEELLRKIDYPNVDAIIQRLNERRAQQAEAQQQQEQQKQQA